MNNLRKYLLIIIGALAITVTAQNITPYSMYGYGILGERATSMQRQMGSVGIAQNSGRLVNVMNPASYAATDSMTFLFDMGVDMTMLWSKEDAAKQFSMGGGVDYVAMQFPISKHFGGSIGLVPYSSVGYAFGNKIAHGSVENQGSGGLNELYVGFAGTIKGFYLGFNASYMFGTIANDVFSTPTGHGETKFEHVMKISDWNILVGAQYTFKFNRFNKVTMGLTWSPKKTLLGRTRVTSQAMKLDTKLDTIADYSMKNRYYTPDSWGAGISYTYEKNYKVTAEFDFSYQGWKDCLYSELRANEPMVNPGNVGYKEGDVVFEGMTFDNRIRYAAGLEYIPKLRGNYGQRMTYRIGGYYCNDYLNIKGNGLKEYGISGGFGFPTPEGKTIVNFGLEWKHRQASPQALVKENYFNITLGVNFNEVWFFKRRIR